MHHAHVQAHAGLEGGRVLALDPQDVVDLSGPRSGGVVDLREQTGGVFGVNDVDPCHERQFNRGWGSIKAVGAGLIGTSRRNIAGGIFTG